jgi:hypothetical protein
MYLKHCVAAGVSTSTPEEWVAMVDEMLRADAADSARLRSDDWKVNCSTLTRNSTRETSS